MVQQCPIIGISHHLLAGVLVGSLVGNLQWRFAGRRSLRVIILRQVWGVENGQGANKCLTDKCFCLRQVGRDEVDDAINLVGTRAWSMVHWRAVRFMVTSTARLCTSGPSQSFFNDFVFQTLREYKGETLFLFLTSSTSSASVINWEARTRARTRHLTSLADLTHPFVDKWEQIPAVGISQKTGSSHGRILKTGVHFRIYTL